ncbi:MAG: BamA/TamA family outer membrane protein [Bacteroidota bacterium]
MYTIGRLLFFVALFLASFVLDAVKLGAQTAADSIYVEIVNIIGHKKTRPGVIFREMPFGRGDRLAIADLPALVEEAQNNLMNTGLFTRADLKYADWESPGNRVTFELHIEETWYIYPVPVFELADRNFNVWWSEQGRSLDRVNFGLKFTHYNFSGRRDRLKLNFQYGYTREYSVGYRLPYLGKKQNLGLDVNWSFNRRREQNYATSNNTQLFYQDRDQFVYRRSDLRATLSYRKKLYTRHDFTMGWRHEQIADTIAQELNPNFFGFGRDRQDFLSLEYRFTSDRRDVRAYPWSGNYFAFRLNKAGLGILGQRSGLTFRGDYRRYMPVGEKFSFSTSVALKYSLIRSRQPFLDNQALGFGNNTLVGYQFYVIDGLDMLILRAGLRRELFNTEIRLPKLVFIDAFRRVPIRLMASAQVDQGWVNMPFRAETNALANNWLTGIAVGLDMVIYYNMAASFRYHRNHLGEGSFLLEFDSNF